MDGDDSTGKHKHSDVKSRSAVLTAALIVGICLGIITAEQLYVRSQEAQHPEAVARSRKLQTGGGLRDLGLRSSGPPRNDLERLLRQVAPEGEVLIAISNSNLLHGGELQMWIDCVKRLSFPNWLVVSLDEELRDYLNKNGVNTYYRPVVIPESQKNSGSNHATSAMKYQILREFLELGWNVLLSDVDVVTVQNPFDHLYRDSDVEGMSDGFDEATAYGSIYGVDDASMGWSRYAQGTQHMALNSGLFYLVANERTIELMHRIDDRLMKEKAWDQSVYNMEIFYLSHGDYKSPQVSVRVMDIFKFMNSKVLFKNVRNMPRWQQPTPVMVHMNYHPNKGERMKGAIEYFIHGNADALKRFPGGSEPGSK